MAIAVPLTPEERENRTQPHHDRTRPIRRALNDCLPLPAGEGRGEGESLLTAGCSLLASALITVSLITASLIYSAPLNDIVIRWIQSFGPSAPWVCVAIFLAASFLMIWRLESLGDSGLEGTVLGTLVMPYCSGLGNLVFAFVLEIGRAHV